MRNDPSNSGLSNPSPPVVFQDVRSSSADLEPQLQTPLKTDWRDFLAITLAVYQILLGPLLLIVGGVVGVFLLFLWLTR